jgi:hypothetical protein
MVELGIVVGIGKWRAVVHYTDCLWYRRSQNHIPIPGRMPVRLCPWCCPSEEDIRRFTPPVEWYEFSPSFGASPRPKRVYMDIEQAENIHARRNLGWGRTPARNNANK